jgi:hypothetical protein
MADVDADAVHSNAAILDGSIPLAMVTAFVATNIVYIVEIVAEVANVDVRLGVNAD